MKKKVNVDDLNGFEASIYKQLTASRNIKKLSFEAEEIKYTVPAVPAVYTPDFVIELTDGRTIYLETKGYLRPEHKKKMQLVRKQHPDLDIRIVFQRDHRLPHSKVTYTKWAEKTGYPSSVGQVPKEWFS